MSHRKPYAIGLVGGIASGKSFVASRLKELGAAVIDADTIGHAVLHQPLVIRRLVQQFGTSVLDEDSNLDRSALAALVFGSDPEAVESRAHLESIVHPIIHAEAVRQLLGYRESEDPPKAVVIDAPLLLEADWAPMCDLILFVETPLEVRVARAEQRGWTVEQFRDREASQLDLDEKRAAATHIVHAENAQQLQAELRGIWDQLD